MTRVRKAPHEPPAEPSARQREVFATLYSLTRAQGYQPSLAELATACGVKLTCASHHLRELRARGWVGDKGSPRTRSVPFLRTPDGSPFRGFAEKLDD